MRLCLPPAPAGTPLGIARHGHSSYSGVFSWQNLAVGKLPLGWSCGCHLKGTWLALTVGNKGQPGACLFHYGSFLYPSNHFKSQWVFCVWDSCFKCCNTSSQGPSPETRFDGCSNFAAVNLLFKENAVTYIILVSEICRRALTQRA